MHPLRDMPLYPALNITHYIFSTLSLLNNSLTPSMWLFSYLIFHKLYSIFYEQFSIAHQTTSILTHVRVYALNSFSPLVGSFDDECSYFLRICDSRCIFYVYVLAYTLGFSFSLAGNFHGACF